MAQRTITRRETPRRGVAELFNEAADDADRAIQLPKEWGVRVKPASRLARAASTLRDVAANRQLPVDQAERREVANALFTALDFSDASAALPTDRVASLRTELEESLGGSLVPGDPLRRPWQLQSQHLVLGVLSTMGLDPRIPTAPAKKRQKRPDFIVERGLFSYGIEVKRLDSPRAGPSRVLDANQQLAEYNVKGGVVVDVTDVVNAASETDFEIRLVELAGEMIRTIWLGPPAVMLLGSRR